MNADTARMHRLTRRFADANLEAVFAEEQARKTPQALVQMLDRIFTEFDTLAETHGLEKIKTIGDAYMAAAGLPERRAARSRSRAKGRCIRSC